MKRSYKTIKNTELLSLIDAFLKNKDGKNYAEAKINQKSCIILPGLCDAHVHFREPGFSYKETIETGSKSASRGGYTTVYTMPNLKPVPDDTKNLKLQLDLINNCNLIQVIPYGAITKGERGEELADLEKMKDDVVGFSDDGRGVQNKEMMKSAMQKAKSLNKLIVAHCEDNSLLFGGYIHDGKYAKEHNHKGICSESEYKQIERDISLLKETNAGYHVCHVSTKESVELIRKAKKEGINITCETAPHYLILCEDDLKESGDFKMNPPLRAKEDKEALIKGILDGTIDIIATDHAPHSIEEKSKGLNNSAFGIVGLETAFPLMYTHFVKTNVISMEKLIELMVITPRKRFNVELNPLDFTVFEIDTEYKINPEEFLSKGRSTPFKDSQVVGKCLLTVRNGQIIFEI